MVAIVTGNGLGVERSSGFVLGSRGMLGDPAFNRFGENVMFNAATGNLFIGRTDDILKSPGPDNILAHAYNSLGTMNDDNGDNTQLNAQRRLNTLTGTLNTAGSTITRYSTDGSNTVYTWNATYVNPLGGANGAYVSMEGSGAYDSLTWNAGTSKWTWVDGDSLTTEIYETHTAGGKIQSSKDTIGNGLTYTYDAGNTKLVRIAATSGDRIDFTWTGNNITSVISTLVSTATQTRVIYGYDGSNRLSTVTTDLTPGDNSVADGAKVVTTYTYDSTSKRIASIAQTGGALLSILYDGSQRVSSFTQTTAAGQTSQTSFTYGAGFTTVTDQYSQQTKLYYDASKQLTRIEFLATSQNIYFAYNANGDVTSTTDGLNNVTTNTYDGHGNLTLQRDQAGNTITRTYSNANRVLVENRYIVPDPDGGGAGVASSPMSTRYAYDANNQLRFSITAQGRVTEYLYTGDLVTSTVTYPLHTFDLTGYTTTTAPTEAQMATWVSGMADKADVQIAAYVYDVRGQLQQEDHYATATAGGVGQTSSGGSRINYTYDPYGNLLTSTVNGVNTETYTYDGLARMTSSIDVNGASTTIAFTDSTNTTVLTMANGFIQTSIYNLAGQLVSFAKSGSGFTTATTTYKYDALGRLRMIVTPVSAGVTQANYTLFDAVGRKVADIAHDGAIVEYGYDADDRLVKTIRYVNKVSGTNLTNLATQLGTNGNLANIALSTVRPSTNAADKWEWRIYDTADRLIETIDGAGDATIFAYDGASQLIKTTSYYNVLAVSGYKTTTPTTLQTPTLSAANDRVSRVFYDLDGRLVGTLDALGFLTEVVYDAAGQKVRESSYANVTGSGFWVSGTFAQLLGSITVSATRDQHVRYIYDGQGNLRYTLDANLRVTEYVYKTSANIDAHGAARQTIDYAGSIASQGTYSFATVTTAIVTANLAANVDNRSSWAVYDASGRLAYAIDAEGGVVRFGYDSLGRTIKTTAFDTKRTTTTLPDLATMVSWASGAAVAADRVSRTFYDLSGRVVYSVDGENYVTEYRYDQADRTVLTIRYADVYAVTDGTTTASLATLIGSIPGTAVQTSFIYDPIGRLSDSYADTSGLNIRTNYVYDSMNRVTDTTIAFATADAATTHIVYDAAGRVSTETRAYGATEASTITYAYDGLNNVVSRTDGRGNATTYTYDKTGNVLTATVPIELATYTAVTTYTYDAFGNVLSVLDPRGNLSYSFYDKLGRLTLQLDNEGFATRTNYSTMSEVSSVIRYATKYTGSVTLGTEPTITLDAVEDATTGFTRDKLGRITRVTDAMNAYENYTLNAFGDRTTVTNKLGGNIVNTYDHRGLLTLETLPMNSVNSAGTQMAATVSNKFEYDARGNRTRMIEAFGLAEARTTDYIYDKLDRLVQTNGQAFGVASNNSLYADSPTTPSSYITYDRVGNIIKTVDPAGAQTFSYYDDLGRKIAEINALKVMSAWTYDANGNVLTARVYGDALASFPGSPGGTPPAPVNGSNYRQTSFAYDRANRLVTTTTVLPTGTLRIGNYNGTSFTTSTAGSFLTSTNYYNRNGDIVQQTDGRLNSIYTYYDKLGRRVAQVDQDNFLTVWTLDADGNVTAETRSVNPVGFTPVADRPGQTPTTVAALQASAGVQMDSDRTTVFTYDKNGRRLTETRKYVLAHSVNPTTGALTQIGTVPTLADSTVIYTYNGLGEVTRKTEATGDYIDYAYDQMGRQTSLTSSAFTDYTGASVQRSTNNYYNGVNNLTRTVQNGAGGNMTSRATTYTYDAAGHLTVLTDPAGKVHNYSYDIAGRQVRDVYLREVFLAAPTTDGQTTRYDLLGRVIGQGARVWNGSAWAAPTEENQTAYNVYGDVTGRGINATTQEFFDYDAAGKLWRTNTGDGVVKLFFYDANGNQTLTISSSGAAPSGYTWAGLTIEQANTLLTTGGATIGNYSVTGMVVTISVYTKRNQNTETREPLRETTAVGSSLSTISHKRIYNAFGEVKQEIDARGNVTDYYYSTMGRFYQKLNPTVNWTAENGAVASARPTETYYFDLSGRMIAVLDANGNLNKRSLLAGTGYESSDPLVVKEFHADGGILVNDYDVFNDRRTLTNELGKAQSFSYDGNGNLTEHDHALRSDGVRMIDHYTYDVLNRQLLHTNDLLGSSYPAGTFYDAQGRIGLTIDQGADGVGGQVSAYTYSWNPAIGATGLATLGSWTKTMSSAIPGMSSTQTSDYFGRVIDSVDYGGHNYDYSFDPAGRLVSKSNSDGLTMATIYYNTGQVADILTTSNTAYNQSTAHAVYQYDVEGNRTVDALATSGSWWHNGAWTPYSIATQCGVVTWDAMNRMTSYTDTGPFGSIPAAITYQYDKVGNVRATLATYRWLDSQGTPSGGPLTQDYWYKYDAMSRFVTTQGRFVGSLGSGSIDHGEFGHDITYDAAGQRVTSSHVIRQLLYDEGGAPYILFYTERENYTYTADGYHATTTFASSSPSDPSYTGVYLPPVETYWQAPNNVATYTRDAMGRVTDYLEGTAGQYRRQTTYNARSEITSEIVTNGLQVNNTTNYYDTIGDGTGAWMGGVVKKAVTNTTINGVAQPITTLTNNYVWWDSAKIADTTYVGATTNISNYHYTDDGALSSVNIADGRPRVVWFVTDPNGNILQRDEEDGLGTGDPREIHYFAGGKQVGMVGNNGTSAVNTLEGVSAHTAIPGTGPFRYGAAASTIYLDFDQSYDPINGLTYEGSFAMYTVRAGDTLQSIAQQLWGDSTFWYMIAEANGLNGTESLQANQRLVIPNKIHNSHNNAGTFKPYDPNEAAGDLSPTAGVQTPYVAQPKPPKKGGCGVFGKILLLVIAVAVTIIAMPSAIATTTILQGALAGAAGSVVSQGVGVLTGLQDKFSFKGVAMSAIAGGVTAGLGAGSKLFGDGAFSGLSGSAALQTGLRGATGSIITQGIGVATGLQRKFDFAGVAAAGVGAGIGKLIGGAPAVSNVAGGIAASAAESLVTGRNFGDTLMANLPSIIGNAIGSMIADAIARRSGPRLAYQDPGMDNGVAGGTQNNPSASAMALATGGGSNSAAAQALAAADQRQQAKASGDDDIVVTGRRILAREAELASWAPRDSSKPANATSRMDENGDIVITANRSAKKHHFSLWNDVIKPFGKGLYNSIVGTARLGGDLAISGLYNMTNLNPGGYRPAFVQSSDTRLAATGKYIISGQIGHDALFGAAYNLDELFLNNNVAPLFQSFGGALPGAVVPGLGRIGGRAGAVDGGIVTLYRVDDVAFAPRIAADGSIPIVTTRAGGERTLFVNFGQAERAAEFALINRGGNATVTAVDVNASLLERLRRMSVVDTSSGAGFNPTAPLRVDINRAPDQFGLRTPDQIQMLRDAIIPGTVRVVDPRTLGR